MNLDEINSKIKELVKIKRELELENFIKELASLEWVVELPDEHCEDLEYCLVLKNYLSFGNKIFSIDSAKIVDNKYRYVIVLDSFSDLINFIKKHNFKKINCNSLNRIISNKEIELNNFKHMRDQIKNV